MQNKTKCGYLFQSSEKFDGQPYCTMFNEKCVNISFVCPDNCQVYENVKEIRKFKKICLMLLLLLAVCLILPLVVFYYFVPLSCVPAWILSLFINIGVWG